MDQMVLKTQQWLNKTYKGRSGYVEITEDGVTGWNTMEALITGLQIELGISSPNGNFGPATTSSFSELSIGSTKTNQIYILQGGLYCKGYDPNGFDGSFGNGAKDAIQKLQSDAGIAITGTVNALLMKSILSMDSFKLLTYGEYNGDENIRTIQRNLNRNYSSNQYFSSDIGLVPCDGIYGRATNKALLYAFQIEEGIPVPNGVFGPSTTSLCPNITTGSTQTKFIYLLQYALYCNNFDPSGFDGSFGNGTKNAVINFQKFVGLNPDGNAGKQTWASLLVSTGDNTRKGTMCDCATTITDAKAKTLKNNGYISVGRYLTGKFKLTNSEINTILNNGLRIFPIFETGGYMLSYFSISQGINDARTAIAAAHDFGFDSGTIIYFTVDFDALDSDVTSSILPYFIGINSVFKRTATTYKIGIYAPRNVCSRISEAGITCSSFVCDMSSGFSGNLGYPLPKDWAIDQISTITIGSGDGMIEIDNNISSGRDLGVSNINIGNNANGIPDTFIPVDPEKPQPTIPLSNGFEYIVTCGYEGDETSVPERWHYNFIETSLKKVLEHAEYIANLPYDSPHQKDTIAWIIENKTYSKNDLMNIASIANGITGVKLVLVNSKTQLFNYLNTGDINGNGTRKQNIAEFTHFGHGYPGFLAFGPNYNSDPIDKIEIDDIKKINKNCFYNPYSLFYSCNTATNDNKSFAYAWKEHLGGQVKACVNKTTYEYIMYKTLPATTMDKIRVNALRLEFGFCRNGSDRYPIPDEQNKAYWTIF